MEPTHCQLLGFSKQSLVFDISTPVDLLKLPIIEPSDPWWHQWFEPAGVTDAENLAALGKIRNTRWGSDQPPGVTTLVVAALAAPELQVEIEVMAGV